MNKDADFGSWAKVMLDELAKLDVEFEAMPVEDAMPVEAEQFKQFNLRFMLALDCYMPSVAQALFKDCREDIKKFGFDRAQKKWEQFIVGSLTGEGDV